MLAGPTLANWVPVAVFGCAASLVATIAGLTMRETYKTHMHDLGKPERHWPPPLPDRISSSILRRSPHGVAAGNRAPTRPHP